MLKQILVYKTICFISSDQGSAQDYQGSAYTK